MNAGLEEIMQKILGLTDISAEMSGQFCSLFNQVQFSSLKVCQKNSIKLPPPKDIDVCRFP